MNQQPTDMPPAPFRHGGLTVLPDWIDYNGHMNVAYYVVLADQVIDAAFETLGMGPDYVGTRSASFFTVEMHVCYLRELVLGAPVEGTFQLISHDEKRLRGYVELIHTDEGFPAASAEFMFVHVDMNARRGALSGRCRRQDRSHANHARQPAPTGTGRTVDRSWTVSAAGQADAKPAFSSPITYTHPFS